MRFTKIPLIATLMAVALSLLIVLPTLAQNTDNDTDGQLSVRSLTVGVFANIADAEEAKMVDAGGNNAGNFIPIDPIPGTPPGTPPVTGVGDAAHASGEAAWLKNNTSSPRDTLFQGRLYVSNAGSAYNTVLVNFLHPADTDQVDRNTCKAAPNAKDANVTATIKNNRSGKDITIELAQTPTTVGADPNQRYSSQAFFKVVHEDVAKYDNGTPNDATDDIAYRQHNGPTFCADASTVDHDKDSNTAAVANETTADSARYYPVNYVRDDTSGLYPAAQEIGTIFARHGDRLTVTVSGDSGAIEIEVDGEGPDFTAITPEDNTVTRPNRLNFGFEVRDDDSGLRHDGEAVITPDGDLKEVNPDGDQHLQEPLSIDPNSSIGNANGDAADIDVDVVAFPATFGGDVTYADISASGTWRMAGNRAGVAYSFTASGADRADASYLYKLVAKDRAGNMTTTDADLDESGNQPFVFRVDNEDPDLAKARTGISYDTTKNEEKVDRSSIALDFGIDALGEVDTSNITVVGHTIESVIHPSKAPEINRNTTKATKPLVGHEKKPTAPTTVAAPADPIVRSGLPGTRTQMSLSETVVGTTESTCSVSAAPTLASPGDTEIGVNTNLSPAADTANETPYCAAWEARRLYLIDLATYNTKLNNYNNYVQYGKENPGRDIENDYIEEPRARIYLQLADDLASDERPTVVIVGGAVYDLAGNTNEAETLEKSDDWIAPGLTVTVTGTASDRAVANAKGAFSVDVRSDEDLERRPVVYFVEIEATQDKGKDTDTKADDVWSYAITEHATDDNVDTAANLTQQEDENHWAKTYKTSSIEGHFNGLVGVIVVAQDEAENIGATAGWTKHGHRDSTTEDAAPNEGDKIDPSKMHGAGLLVEIDKVFNKDVKTDIGQVTPRSNDAGTETESANPFVKLSFKSEGSEYTDGEFKDSHATVTVDKVTLDGENAAAMLNRVSSTEFSLLMRDLAVGSYKVEYTVLDDAKNEYKGKFEFEVKERQPYEVEVKPGWNLVSLPATPLEPAIGDVLSGNSYVTPVLGYQQGDWLTAIQEEDGTWRGRLATIEGGYGYWVHARTFSTVETMLAEVDPAETLPTVPVTAGWNLLGVLDIFQNKAGVAPGDGGNTTNGDEADNYFSSIPWKVAYTYDTTKSLWVKSTPGNPAQGEDDPPEIANGKGYWVWSPTPSTLVP